jgi:hypothetical protein
MITGLASSSTIYRPVHRPVASNQEGVLPGNILPLAIVYTIQVGMPPRSLNISVDTGSVDMLVPTGWLQRLQRGGYGV